MSKMTALEKTTDQSEMTVEQLVKSRALAIQALEGLALLDPGLVRRIARGGTNEKAIEKAVREALSQALPSSIQPEVRYVLGFVFNSTRSHTLLQFKNSSTRNPGLINGFGKAITERFASPVDVMVEAFREQTGIQTDIMDWAAYGSYGLDATVAKQPGTYSIRLFVATLPDDVFTTFQNAFGDDVVSSPVNLEVFNRKGAQGLGWMFAGALDHLKYGTTCVGEVFPMRHLIDADDTPAAKP